MNILVYTSLFPNTNNPDFGIFIKNRIQHVASIEGNKVVVVAPVPYCPPFKFLGKWYDFSKIPKKAVIDGIEVYHPRYFLIPKISMALHGFLMYWGTLGLVKKLHDQERFNLMDVHYVYPDGYAGMLLSKKLKLPFSISARGTDINKFPKFRTIRPLIQKTLEKASAVIAVCSALKEVMVGLGCSSKKIAIIPNGIDVTRFDTTEQSQARQELHLEHDKKIILSAASLIKIKGHHLTIAALSKVIDNFPDTHLFIAGKGEYETQLRHLIRKLRLSKHVTLLGHVPNADLYKWYSAADVFCLSSSREGWANVIMESMACGTPVVATNVGGAPEIISNSYVGILVDREPQAISTGIQTAFEKQWDAPKIRTHVSSRTWGVVADEVNLLFNKMLNR